MSEPTPQCCPAPDLSEADVIAAMKEIQGYIDLTPGEFREIFQIAHRHALQRIRESRTARDIMTRKVQCLDSEMDLLEAANLLADQRFSGAPVINAAGKVVGVLSEKDFLARMGLGKTASFLQIVAHCLANKGCMVTALRNHAVAELMTAPPIIAGPEITLGAISELFIDRQINRLPIVDSEARPVGMVTRTDLVQAFALSR